MSVGCFCRLLCQWAHGLATHSFDASNLCCLCCLLLFRLIARFIEVTDVSLLVSLVLQSGFVQLARLQSLVSHCEKIKGRLTGASSRIHIEQYLHQYCFFDTQYLTVRSAWGKIGFSLDTHSVIFAMKPLE